MEQDKTNEAGMAEAILIRVVLGDAEIERKVFCIKEKISIGRDPYTDIPLEDPSVSRLHLVIQREPTGLVLHDKSSNGTSVNGTLVKKHTLRTGDVITAGRFHLIVECYADSKASFFDEAHAEGRTLDDDCTIVSKASRRA